MPWILNDKNGQGYTPMISIRIDGKEVAAGFYGRLISATVHDAAGQNSDSCNFELDDARNELETPREKATIEIDLGYKETGLLPRGTYELQDPQYKFGPGGDRLYLTGKAADLRRSYKGGRRQAWDGDDITFGQIARDIAKRAGVEPVIDSELDKIKVGYQLQYDQSDIDFLTRLGDDHGAIIKPAGGKLVVARSGEAKSVSGKDLQPIIISRSDIVGDGEITPQSRPSYGKVRAGWWDEKTGQPRWADSETGMDGPDFVLPRLFGSKDEAERAGKAEGRALRSDTGNGSIKIFGRPDAQAEAPLIFTDFRQEIRDGNWTADSVDNVFDTSGYLTSISVKNAETKGSNGGAAGAAE